MHSNEKIILILFLLFSLNVQPQGTCASPNGANSMVLSTPIDWQWLSDNGYCFTGAPMVTKNLVMCFTLTSPGADIEFNVGYTSIGCNGGVTINYARLYTSSPGCALVSSAALGIVNGVTPGAQYTWCISAKCLGPGPGFNSFCPWFLDRTPLSVDLLFLMCNKQILKWITSAEYNNDYFLIQSSDDLQSWNEHDRINGNLTTSIEHEYSINVGCVSKYFRLKTVDIDGGFKYTKITHCSCKEVKDNKYYVIYNILGQEIPK